LNDPYKRDRIDGCMLDIFRYLSFWRFFSFHFCLGYKNQRIHRGVKGLKMGVIRVLRVTGVLRVYGAIKLGRFIWSGYPLPDAPPLIVL
jgi:hypothetical protein